MYNPSEIRFKKNAYLDREYCIGSGHRPIINASIGTSQEENSFETELQKAAVAVAAGAGMITDHSICGDVIQFHKLLRRRIHVPLACIPIYELSLREEDFSEQQAVEFTEEMLRRGFNILVLHATPRLSDVAEPITRGRVIPITSKGGRLALDWMERNRAENPFYSGFSQILQIVKKYNGAISLAPTYRPASVVDNSMDPGDAHWIEISRMAELVERAIAAEVPIMVEGIGHAQISNIPEYVERGKKACHNVPYKVLTVATDIALGYDNIASAIASSIAVLHGADVVTGVTASEHIALPSVEQVEAGVVTANIAIHSAELCRNGSIEKDRRMSLARAERQSCQGRAEEALFPTGAKRAVKKDLFEKGCSMCGRLCAFYNKEDRDSE